MELLDELNLKLDEDRTDSIYAGEFLLQSGLLFEINRRILHPLGLAMCVQYDRSANRYVLSETMLDGRHIPGGLEFDPMTLGIAEDLLFKFMEEFGVGKMQERQRIHGYVLQKSNEMRRSESI